MFSEYTSADTQCDQNIFEKAKSIEVEKAIVRFLTIRLIKRKRNKTPIAPKKADIKLIRHAISLMGKKVNIFPRIQYRGYPGGCKTPRIYGAVRYSPESSVKLLGHNVKVYTINGRRKAKKAVVLCARKVLFFEKFSVLILLHLLFNYIII